MSYLLNEKVRNFEPYQPISGNYRIRLDANESFLEISDRMKADILTRIANLHLNRYPDPTASAVCVKAGMYLGVKPELITVGNGSDELLTLITQALMSRGEKLVYTSPDFSMYQFYGYLAENDCIEFKKDDQFNIDVDALIDLIQREGARTVIFSNPCNPTGVGLPRKEVLRLIEGVPDCLTYFKAQEKGSLSIYAVTSELHGKPDFDASQIDETVPGCQGHLYFGEKQYLSLNKFIKVTDNLYGGVCHFDSLSFKEGDITLVPVDDFESVKKSIIENMDSKEIGLIDKYTGKKRDIDFEGTIFKAEISSRIVQSYWTDVTLAFIMKESDEPIEEYAEMNEKERSFFGYNMNGKEFNATCLCSRNSRSVLFDYKVGDEVYFWFGTQK